MFDRRMSQLRKAPGYAKTIIFPNTVREVQCDAFWQANQLKAIITNEGLEALGELD